MLSKEKCEVCLNQFIEDTNYYMGDKTFNDHEEEIDILQQLIKKHFELVEKHEMLESTYSMICEDYLNQQSYKFEDLKEVVGKPIYDRKYKEFYILTEVKEEEVYKDEGIEKFMICSDKNGLIRVWYEENRFYPIHIAK